MGMKTRTNLPLTDADIQIGGIYMAEVYSGWGTRPGKVQVIGFAPSRAAGRISYKIKNVETNRTLRGEVTAGGLEMVNEEVLARWAAWEAEKATEKAERAAAKAAKAKK